MVKVILCFLCLCWLGVLEAEPFVDASVDSMSSQAHFPLQGTITITHKREEKVDPQSFVMESKPLDVSFVKDAKMSASSDTLVSIYSFQLPAKDKGLYVLPSISMKIDGKTYQTIPSTYEVQEETTASPTASSTTPTTPLIFRLDASIEGPSTLYPGERTKLLYRISYNRSIDLTKSKLPMVHPQHFQKVGDVQIKNYQLKDVTVQDLTQEVEASELGTFSFGPSVIEGYAYSMQTGQKVYDPTLLKAQAPIVTLEVKPFPQPSQPASFTGALGTIQAEAHLTSASSVAVGDTLQLQVKVQGVTNLTELRLPVLHCQPGFSGFFQMSDLPPLAEVKDKDKFFYVELRPLTSLAQQIPSIEVSSFNPETNKYITQNTQPIPIHVTAHTGETTSLSSIPSLMQIPPIGKWPTPPLPPLEMKSNGLEQSFISPPWLESKKILWMIPIGLILLLLQQYWWKQWKQHPKPSFPESEKLLKQAFKTQSLQILERAFWHRLWEKGKIPKGLMHLDKVSSKEEKMASIYSFIFYLQALQYSWDKNFNPQQLQQQAQQLFFQI